MTRKRTPLSSTAVDEYLDDCAAAGTAPRVSELATRLGMSRVTLNLRFQELTGTALSDYFAAHRDRRAADLLAASELKTYAIAMAAGFGTSRTFHRVFVRRFGTTPARYRKLIRMSAV